MTRTALPLVALALLFAVLVGGWNFHPNAPELSRESIASAHPAAAVCFAPGTPEEYMRRMQDLIWEEVLDYQIGDRWGYTATDGSTGSQGTPITITYSFVPDGTPLPGLGGGSQPSQLFARMNALFGSQAAWQAKFAEVFQRWSEVCGIEYVQVSDDGASFPNASGQLGTRGDVRIGSRNLDGASGVLAFNYFPDMGDMVLDAGENWASSSGNYNFLRNVAAHEHGHGWGLSHVCPANNTKLLEPFYSGAFDGPQHDDVRAAQRNYGDTYEPNDDASAAVHLGVLAADTTLIEVGLDDDSDVDYWKFRVPAGKGFSLSLEPVGWGYLDGPQNEDGSCTEGTPINTHDDLNLDLYLYNTAGSVLRGQSTTHPAGQIERITRYAVPAAGDSFAVRVAGGGANAMQCYDLVFDIYNLYDPHLTVDPIVFDTTRLGTPGVRTTTLINNAPYPLQISQLEATGPFTVIPAAPQTVPVGGSLEITLTYLASQPGQQTGTLRVTHNGPGGLLVAALTGTAVESSLEILVSDDVNFGDVGVGEVDSARAPVRATGNVPLTITQLVTAAPFSGGHALPLTLNPGQTFFLRPRFAPTELGTFDGELVIIHNGTSSPDTLYLHGTAVPSAAEDRPDNLPAVYRLDQNYPNPFNPATKIGFDLPRAGSVALQVFDIQGRLVRELVRGDLAAGHHVVEFDGRALAAGVYLYRLTAPGFEATAKMVLMK